MSSAPKGKAWASDEDWQKHRDIITNLWWVEDKPLKEVQAVMAEEYDFHASDKMYKGRLKTWGLLKNLKSKDAEQIMGLAKSGAATGPLVIRGRSMGSKKWQKRLNRVVAPEQTVSLVPAKRRSLTYTLPLPVHLGAPDTFRLTESGLQAIRDFTSRQFMTQTWDLSGLPYDFDSDITDAWSNKTSLAAQALIKDRNSPANFAILNKCLETYSAVIDQASPQLIPGTIDNIVRMLPVGPEMADMFLTYVTNLVNIKLGEDHPLSRFFSQMQALGAAQMMLITRSMMTAYFDIIVMNSHPANRWRSNIWPTYARIMQRWGALPREAVAVVFEKTISDIESSIALEEAASTDPLHYAQMNRHLHEVKGYYIMFLIDQGKFEEAEPVAAAMGSWLDAGAAREYPEQLEQWLRLEGKILVGLGRPNEATAYFIQTYEKRRSRMGAKNHRTARAVSELEEHYRLLNDIEAAEKLRKEFEASFVDDT